MIVIKPKIGSALTKESDTLLTCPNCGKVAKASLFNAKTSINLSSIELCELHNKQIAVCIQCRTAFEVK